MSTLKQSILEIVQKGENVLQSFDASLSTARGGEGNVYECRFSASVYDPSTGEGVTSSVGDVKKYTRLDDQGVKQTYVIEKKTNDVSLTLTDTLRDVGVAGGVLDIPTYVEDIKSLTDNTKLFLNNSNYFTRNHAAKSASGALVKLGTQDATQKVIIENSDDLLESWVTIRDELFTDATAAGTAYAPEDYATAGQIVYYDDSATADTDKARVFNKKFWGKITPTTEIPSDTIFYYDGVEAIFDDGNGGLKADVSKAGYFMYHDDQATAYEVANEVDTSAIFWDAAGMVAFEATNNGARPARYVISGNSGASATSANFGTSSGIPTLGGLSVKKADGSSDFSESVTEASLFETITSPSATNAFWNARPAITEPIKADGDAQNSDVWAKTTADDLTDSDYWNLISEGFQEDYNVHVGVGGLVNADQGGAYSTLDATGSPKATYNGFNSTGGGNTYRVLEIVSTTASNGDAEVEIKTEFPHGLEPGDTVTIGTVGISVVDGVKEVGTIGGNAGVGNDATLFTLKDVSQTKTGGAIAGTTGLGTASSTAINHLFWGSHNPPTTDQALVYRF